MKRFLDYLCKLFNWDENILNTIIFIVSAVSVTTTLFLMARKIFTLYVEEKIRNEIGNSGLSFYSTNDLERYTKYYIDQYYQNINPAEYDFNSKDLAVAKQKIQPFFIKHILVKKNQEKYILLLADTGMGKTAFLINLYLKILKQERYSLRKSAYTIKLIPLGMKNAFELIAKVENKNRCFLMLDAFDEDVSATRNFESRFKELKLIISDFKCVIITARTQFFASDTEEPYETEDQSMGEDGRYKFKKLYISPFDEIDSRNYITKVFRIWETKKKKRAFQLIERIRIISFRPMLMAHIKDLIKSDVTIKYSHELYDILIKIWLSRESKKVGTVEKYQSEENFRLLLFRFSIKVAFNLYSNSERRGGYYFTKDERINEGKFTIEDFLNENSDELSQSKDREIKTKSLLTRNIKGEYRFAHKSFFEYFLALYIMENPDEILNFNFKGLDQFRIFLEEMTMIKLRQMQALEYYDGSRVYIPLGLYYVRNLHPNYLLVFKNISLFKNEIRFDNTKINFPVILLIIMKDEKLRNELFDYLAESRCFVERYIEKDGKVVYDVSHPLLKEYRDITSNENDNLIFKNLSEFKSRVKSLHGTLRRVLYMEDPKYSKVYPFAIDASFMAEINTKAEADKDVIKELQEYLDFRKSIKRFNELGLSTLII